MRDWADKNVCGARPLGESFSGLTDTTSGHPIKNTTLWLRMLRTLSKI